MAKVYNNSKDIILPGSFILSTQQLSDNREKNAAELRNKLAEDFGGLALTGGQALDMYQRYKSFDENKLQKELDKLIREKEQLERELEMVNNELSTLESVVEVVEVTGDDNNGINGINDII